MEQNQNFLKTKPVFPLLVSMAIPMMLSMLIQSLYNIVDSLFVAKMGEKALAAVSFVYPFQNIVVAVAVGFGVGISAVISMNLGAGNKERANQAATLGMFFTGVHALLFIAAGLLFTKPFLLLFTQDEQILQWGSDYSYIVLCGSFGSLLQISMEKIFQAVGDMITTMFILASGAIINIILDPIMIFGLFGFPELGVAGAAIATVIGQISAFFFYLIVYRKKEIGVKIERKYLRFEKRMIGQLYQIGIPSSVMMALPSVLVSALNGILVAFSQMHVAVLGVYFKLQTFIYMPANGIVQGMRPIVSYNYGAGETERLKKTVRLSLLLVAAIMAVGTAVSLFLPELVFGLFSEEALMIETGARALRIISLGFVISTMGIVYSGTFEALGKGLESLIVSLLRQFLIILPVSWILADVLGADGIWISFPAAEAAASAAAVLLMKRVWKKELGEKNGKEMIRNYSGEIKNSDPAEI